MGWKLNQKGESARDELLALLYPDDSWTDEQLSSDTDIDRGATIPKILGKDPRGMHCKTLSKFFSRLLRKLNQSLNKGDLTEEQVNKYLKKYGFLDQYDQICQSGEDLTFPLSLCKTVKAVSNAKKSRSALQGQSATRATSKSASHVVDLFWHLDYREQERAFEDALFAQTRCVAFSVAAPCPTTQRWLLNRLIRQIPNTENALVMKPIDVERHPMRHEFDEFWLDLAGPLAVHASQESVLNALSSQETSRPIILTLYNQYSGQFYGAKVP